MNSQHPITPPPELVTEWWSKCTATSDNLIGQLATQAARWGADQELEACIEWMASQDWTWTKAQLFAARRPKPPSLKEQALELVSRIEKAKSPWAMSELHTIRCALEALPND
jgi:hypothetical protein